MPTNRDNISHVVTQHHKVMGDAQKKLQELSESYQALQAGENPSHSQHEKYSLTSEQSSEPR
jgi:uncharacterized coiled-coil protein SlyX